VNTEYEEAHNYVTVLLQQGKDSNACAQLAKSLEQEVGDAVDGLNKQLAEMADGSNCVDLGKDGVTAAQASKDAALKAEKDAEQGCNDAKQAPINFEKPLDQLTEGECGTFFNDAAYLSMKVAKETACKAVATAREATKAAEETLLEANEAAIRARHVCQCKAKHAADNAFKEAQKGDADRASSWAKAHHMACVLDGTPPGQCQVPDVPAVVKGNLHADVANAVCRGYIARTVQESGLTCPNHCPISEATLTGKVQCINFSTDAVTSDDECDKVNAKKPDAKTKHCPGMQWGQGHCFLSGPQGNQGCYNIYGGCYEERREGWDGEEQRECFGNGGLSCYPGGRSGNTKYQGCYRSGNGCYPNRL
jgi:hypothetical protein